MEKCKLCNQEDKKYNYDLKFLGQKTKTIEIGSNCGRILNQTNKWEQTNVIDSYSPDFLNHIESLREYITEEQNKCHIKFFCFHDIKQPKKFFV